MIYPESGFSQETSGYIDSYVGLPFKNPSSPVANRSRIRIQPNLVNNQSQFFADLDARHYWNTRSDSTRLVLREFYADLYFAKMDIRIGKQIQRWGKTFSSASGSLFLQLTGEDFVTNSVDELFAGFWGAQATIYSHYGQFTAIISPTWLQPQLPRETNRWFFAIPLDLPLPVTYQFDDNEQTGALNWAFKYQLPSTSSWDASFWVFNWFVNQPSWSKTFNLNLINSSFDLQETYLQTWGLGTSHEWRISDTKRFRADILYWNQRYVDWLPQRIRDVNLQNPSLTQLIRLVQVIQEESDVANGFLRKKPWLQATVGYNWDWQGWQFNHEFLIDQILYYDRDIQQIERFYSTSHQLIKRLSDSFTVTQVALYNLIGSDVYSLTQLSYTFSDEISIESGLHLFLGPKPDLYYPYLSFAAFGGDSFGYLRLKYFF